MQNVLREILSLFTEQLAKLFDKLRISSPIVYLVVLGIIVGGAEVIKADPELIASLPEWAGYVVTVVEVLAAILLSSRTKRHITAHQELVSGAQIKILSAEEAEAMKDEDD